MDLTSDTGTEIAQRLEARDLGRLRCVSKSCEEGCKRELGRRYSETLQGRLVHAHGQEREWVKAPDGEFSVQATFQDILVIRNSGGLLVGSPDRFPGQWKRIPWPDSIPANGRLSDSSITVGLGSDGDLLLFMRDRDTVACAVYSSRRGVWSPVPPHPEQENWSLKLMQDPVYFQGAFYMCVQKEVPDDRMVVIGGQEFEIRLVSNDILRCDPQQMQWSEVDLTHLSDDSLVKLVYRAQAVSLVPLLGRLLIFGVIVDPWEMRCELYELHDGGERMVEVTDSSTYSQMLKAAQEQSAVEFWGSDDDHLVLWMSLGSECCKRVSAYSIVHDRCLASVSAGERGNCYSTGERSYLHHTGAGDSFVHFNALPFM